MVFLNQDRDTYLAYECKRLNVRRRDGRRSLSTEYVKDGLLRFVESQYSDNLPIGCMLGYVLDGDLDHATSSVKAKIVDLRDEVRLVVEPQPDAAIGLAVRFYSRHHRDPFGKDIEIRHTLLPM